MILKLHFTDMCYLFYFFASVCWFVYFMVLLHIFEKADYSRFSFSFLSSTSRCFSSRVPSSIWYVIAIFLAITTNTHTLVTVTLPLNRSRPTRSPSHAAIRLKLGMEGADRPGRHPSRTYKCGRQKMESGE